MSTQTGEIVGDWRLDELVGELREVRRRWRESQARHREIGVRAFPSREALEGIANDLRAALFPLRLGPVDVTESGEDHFVGYTLNSALNALLAQVRIELGYVARATDAAPAALDRQARELVGAFARSLPRVRELIDTDVEAAFLGDPAARSVDEVLLCYPGIIAIIHHRLAHELHGLGAHLIARVVSEIAHSRTGIDIHPGARVGSGFFIDHGTGVVIGETAVIGDRVRIYQGVTLGAKFFPVEEDGALSKGGARHPIIEDDVVIYAGATILGRVTIGKGSTIGGNVWLTRDTPPGSHITQANSKKDGRLE